MNSIYNNCLIKLNEEKFRLYHFVFNEKLNVFLSDKSSFKTVLSGVEPIMILEVLEDEFLVSWKRGENKFLFQHLSFDRDKKEVITKYEREYTSLSDEGEVKFKKDLVILEEENGITIYNYKNSKSVELDKFEILSAENFDKDCLIGKIDIRNRESVIFSIDNDDLDIQQIYSVLQDRFIPVVKDQNLALKLRLFVTLESEIYPDLERIEEEEEYMRDKKVDRACKKLIKK